jgi:demethylmenaquinone methyltransferase/2-methoxy-6-polyprenyl-1,4-benzoquinol methylase
VRRLFATIADRYDFITGFLSYGQDRRWKRQLIQLAALQSSDRVLDLACGTGDLILLAAPRVKSAVGLDVTFRMLQLARRRAAAASAKGYGGPPELQRRRKAPPMLITGDMTALPLAERSFDVVTTGYGLRNVPDLDQALSEIRRVLAPGGRLLSLDFNRPRTAIVRTAYHAYLTLVGSLLGLALHGDPQLSRRGRRRADDGGAWIHPRARRAGAVRADGDSRGGM